MPWVSYADSFEDVVLHRALEEVSGGIYVDLGPLDPKTDSVTKHFYDRNWRGVDVVADAKTRRAFHEARPEDVILIGDEGQAAEEGTSEGSWLRDGEAESAQKLDAVLRESGVESVHFLRAESGGWPGRLLLRFPFSRVRPWIVILQRAGGHPNGSALREDEGAFLASQGYECVQDNGRSRFYLAAERAKKKALLAASPSCSDDFISARDAEEIEALRKHGSELSRLVGMLTLETQRLEAKRQASPLRRLERGVRSVWRSRPDRTVPDSRKDRAPEAKPVPMAGDPEVLRLSGLQTWGNPIGERPRILVLQVDHIGDFITRLPALGLLRSLWPEAEIDLICGPWNVPLARKCAYFRKIIPFTFFPERSGHWRTSRWKFERLRVEFAGVCRELGDYDLAIDLRADAETRYLLGLVRAKLRAGYAAPEADVFLDISLPDPARLSPGERNRKRTNRLASALLLIRTIQAHLAPLPRENRHPLVREEEDRVPREGNRLIAVAPGSGSSARRWGTEAFAALSRALAREHRCEILLLGGAGEIADADRIAREIPASQCRNLVGKVDLADLPEQLLGAAVFVGNDSGLSHVAASLGVPTVVVHSGATDVSLAHPVGERVSVVHRPMSCAPCWLARAEECPHSMACLQGISPSAVVEEVLFWLEGAGAPSGDPEPDLTGRALALGAPEGEEAAFRMAD